MLTFDNRSGGFSLNDRSPALRLPPADCATRKMGRCVPPRLQDRQNINAAAVMRVLTDELFAIGTPSQVRARLYRGKECNGSSNGGVSSGSGGAGSWPAYEAWADVAAVAERMDGDELAAGFKIGALPFAAMPAPWAPMAPQGSHRDVNGNNTFNEENEEVAGAVQPVERYASAAAASQLQAAGPSTPGVFPTATSSSNSVSGVAAVSPLRSWADTVEQLRHVCGAVAALARDGTSYAVPRRARPALIPLLYAWLTDFAFLLDSPRVWAEVALLFRRITGRTRAALTLPWRPVADLLLSVLASQQHKAAGGRLPGVERTALGELRRIAQRSACYFDADALDEIWALCAPHLGEASATAVAHLHLLSVLLPIQRVYDPATGAATPVVRRIVDFFFSESLLWQPRHGAWWASARFRTVAALLDPHVGLVDLDAVAEPLFTLAVQSLRMPVLEPADARHGALRSEETSLSADGGLGLYRVDDVAEVLAAFAMVVKALPNATDTPLWNQLRRFLHTTSVFLRPGTPSLTVAKAVYTVYSNMLRQAGSRMRRQAARAERDAYRLVAVQRRRERRAAAAATAAAASAEDVFGAVASSELSVDTPLLHHGHHPASPLGGPCQGDYLGMRLPPSAVAGAGGHRGGGGKPSAAADNAGSWSDDESEEYSSDDDDDEDEEGEEGSGARADRRIPARPWPAEHVWSRETTDLFVSLMLPYVTPALHLSVGDPLELVRDLLHLSPALSMRHLQRYIDAALESESAAESHRISALAMMCGAFPALVGCDETLEPLKRYLTDLLPGVVAWMSPSQPGVTDAIVTLFAAVAAGLSLERDIFGSAAAECDVMSRFFAATMLLFRDGASIPSGTVDCAAMALRYVSDETYAHVMERVVLPVASAQDATAGVHHFLWRCGRPAPVAASSSNDCEDDDDDGGGDDTHNSSSSSGNRNTSTAVSDENAARFIKVFRDVAAPALLSGVGNDAYVSWAWALASSCLTAAGRAAAFEESALVLRCVRALAAQVTSHRRQVTATAVLATYTDILIDVDATAAVRPRARRRQDGEGDDDGGGSAAGDVQPPAVVAALDALDPAIMRRRRLLRSLGFCHARDIALRWAEPEERHLALAMDMCDTLMDEAMHVIAHVERVRPTTHLPSTLRGLIPNDDNNEDVSGVNVSSGAVGATKSGSETAEAVTPGNVLLGSLAWLRHIFRVYSFLYIACDEAHQCCPAAFAVPSPEEQRTLQPPLLFLGRELPTAVRPFWNGSGAISVPLPVPRVGGVRRAPKHSATALAAFAMEHCARRGAGEDALSSLTRSLGDAAASLVDVSLLTAGKGPLDAARAGQGDTRLLTPLVTLMQELSGVREPQALSPMRVGAAHAAAARLCASLVTPRRARGDPAPLQYWHSSTVAHVADRCNAGNYGARSRSVPLAAQAFNLSHLLLCLFPQHPEVTALALGAKRLCDRLMVRPLRRLAVAVHARYLRQLGELWLLQQKQKQHSTTGEEAAAVDELALFLQRTRPRSAALAVNDAAAVGSPASAAEPEGPHEQEKEGPAEDEEVEGNGGGDTTTATAASPTATAAGQSQSPSQAARDCARVAVQVAVDYFIMTHGYDEPDLLFALLQTLMWLPDALTAGQAKDRIGRIGANVQRFCGPVPDDDESIRIREGQGGQSQQRQHQLCATCEGTGKQPPTTAATTTRGGRSAKLWLVEQTLLLAQRLLAYSPVRACACVRVAHAMYQPSKLPHCGGCGDRFQPDGSGSAMTLSHPALQALFRLSTSGFAQLHLAAVEMLSVVLVALDASVSAVTVEEAEEGGESLVRVVKIPVRLRLSRAADDRSAEVIAAFQRRFAALQPRFPLMSLGGAGQHYAAALVTLPVAGATQCRDLAALLSADGMPALADRRDVFAPSLFAVPEPDAARESAWRLGDWEGAGESSLAADAAAFAVGAGERAYIESTHRSLRQLSGLSEGLIAADGTGPPLAERLAVTWVCRLLQAHRTHYATARGSRRVVVLLHALAALVGPAVAVPAYLGLARSFFEEAKEKLRRSTEADASAATGLVEHLCGTYVLATSLILACLHATAPVGMAPPPSSAAAAAEAMRAARASAVELFAELLLYACRQRMPSEAFAPMQTSLPTAQAAMTAAELDGLWDSCFAALVAMAASSPSSSSTASPSPPPSAGSSAGDAAPHSGSGSSQEISRLTFALMQLVYSLPIEKLAALVPHLARSVASQRAVLYGQTTSSAAVAVSSLLRELFVVCRNTSDVIPGNEGFLDLLAGLALEQLADTVRFHNGNDDAATAAAAAAGGGGSSGGVGGEPALLGSSPAGGADHLLPMTPAVTAASPRMGSAPSPSPALGDSSLTLGLPPPSMHPASNPVATDSSGGRELGLVSLPPAAVTAAGDVTTPYTSRELMAMKTVCWSWYKAPATLINRCHAQLLVFLSHVLDVALTEADAAADIASSTLLYVAYARLPKATVHAMIEQLCAALQRTGNSASPPPTQQQHQQQLSFGGHSLKARVSLTRALRVLFFCNMPRIGRFALMQSVAEAALASMGAGGGSKLREEAQLLFSVLTRVASPEQTRVLVLAYERELRALTTVPAAVGDGDAPPAAASTTTLATAPVVATAQRRRRAALVLALCATMHAELGAIPAYLPWLMERLAPYAQGGPAAGEAGQAVKRTFEEWWRAHRAGWELEYKRAFTPAQVDAMRPLLTAPSYYV